jgi:type IV secretion system protein VirB6
MAAGAMLLLFKFTMAFLIGIGPIFILALVFDQTKDLFKKWLFYIIGTLFSMAMLSLVTSMVLKFTAKVAAAYWAVKFIPLGSAEGLSSQALQQGGIGLIMTMLIITVPTIAAALWQGNMGTFMAYSAFNNTAAPGPQGQPAGSYIPQQVAKSEERSAATNSSLHSQATRVTQTAPAQLTQPVGSRGQAGQE